jgi:hypothetical protein
MVWVAKLRYHATWASSLQKQWIVDATIPISGQHPRSTPPFQPLPACKNTSDDAQQLREEGDHVGPGPSDYGSGNIVWIYWGYRDYVGYNVVTLG